MRTKITIIQGGTNMAGNLGPKTRLVKNLRQIKNRGGSLSPRGERRLREFSTERAVATSLRLAERRGTLSPRGKRKLRELREKGF
jgi:hypothetical protein